MDLFVIRHAWAEQRGPEWPDDSLRPLTHEGKERFAAMVSLLDQRDFSPTIVATSPYVRCEQTAQILAAQLSPAPEVDELRELEPGSDFKALKKWTRQQYETGHEQIAWVGHAPDVNELAAAVLKGDLRIRFAKGAIAMFRFDEGPNQGAGELRWLVTAKVLGC